MVVIGLAVAACGGDDAERDGVASLGGDTPGETPEAQRPDVADAVLEFSQCMRDAGIDLPDIALDADGAPLIDGPTLERLDLDSPEFEDAFVGCIDIMTDAGAFSFDFDPEVEAVVQDQLQQFAQCMRRMGIENFPDPVVGDSGTPFPLSAFTDIAEDDFRTALDTCQQESTLTDLDG